MKYRIVSLDLDGTLLDTEMHVSRENRAAIKRLAARGVHIVPNSGRTLAELPEEVRELPGVRYIIHSDGAVIRDMQTDRCLCAAMSRPLSHRVLELLSRYRTNLSVRYRGRSYVNAAEHHEAGYIPYRVPPTYRSFLYDTNEPVPDFARFCRDMEEIEMICAFFADEGELRACSEALREMGEVQVASSVPGNIEVFAAEAGKGKALCRLAEMLGIDPAATIAAGDSTNDSDMILRAGLGLAMENAFPELKAIADGIACHHTAHIVPYLERTYFGE